MKLCLVGSSYLTHHWEKVSNYLHLNNINPTHIVSSDNSFLNGLYRVIAEEVFEYKIPVVLYYDRAPYCAKLAEESDECLAVIDRDLVECVIINQLISEFINKGKRIHIIRV